MAAQRAQHQAVPRCAACSAAPLGPCCIGSCQAATQRVPRQTHHLSLESTWRAQWTNQPMQTRCSTMLTMTGSISPHGSGSLDPWLWRSLPIRVTSPVTGTIAAKQRTWVMQQHQHQHRTGGFPKCDPLQYWVAVRYDKCFADPWVYDLNRQPQPTRS